MPQRWITFPQPNLSFRLVEANFNALAVEKPRRINALTLCTELENTSLLRMLIGRRFWVGQILGFRRVFFSFDSDFYFSALLQGYGLTILVLQRIFNANLFLKVIRPFDCDLRFVWHRWNDSRNDFFDFSGEGYRRFLESILRILRLITHCGFLYYPAGFYAHSSDMALPIEMLTSSALCRSPRPTWKLRFVVDDPGVRSLTECESCGAHKYIVEG
jgi:hypothetical protein